MVARTKKTDADTAVPDAAGVPEPAAETKTRKPRTPKPVTDLASANAAFVNAKKKAATARKHADAAQAAASLADQTLADAAGVLKGYLGEVDAAVGAALPQSHDVPDVHPAEDETPYEGDGYGDTAHDA